MSKPDKKEKTLFLTKDEKSNVSIRHNKIQDKDYEKNLIKNDLDWYIRQVVLPRLGREINSAYKLSEDLGSIEVYDTGVPENPTDNK